MTVSAVSSDSPPANVLPQSHPASETLTPSPTSLNYNAIDLGPAPPCPSPNHGSTESALSLPIEELLLFEPNSSRQIIDSVFGNNVENRHIHMHHPASRNSASKSSPLRQVVSSQFEPVTSTEVSTRAISSDCTTSETLVPGNASPRSAIYPNGTVLEEERTLPVLSQVKSNDSVHSHLPTFSYGSTRAPAEGRPCRSNRFRTFSVTSPKPVVKTRHISSPIQSPELADPARYCTPRSHIPSADQSRCNSTSTSSTDLWQKEEEKSSFSDSEDELPKKSVLGGSIGRNTRLKRKVRTLSDTFAFLSCRKN